MSILEFEEWVEGGGPEEIAKEILEYLSSFETESALKLGRTGEELEDMKADAKNLSKIFQPLFFQAVISYLLGTPKLQIILEEEIDNLDNHIFLRLMYVMLYADLKLPGYIYKIERIVKEVSQSTYYREIIYAKVCSYYSVRPSLSRWEQRRMENIIADIRVGREGLHPRDKATIIGKEIRPLRSQV